MMRTIPMSCTGDPVTKPLTDEEAWEQSDQLDRMPPKTQIENNDNRKAFYQIEDEN